VTLIQAIERADKLTKQDGITRFVVCEAGEIGIGTEVDLDTWWAGIRDENILYATGDLN
jgi:hypothetical protein